MASVTSAEPTTTPAPAPQRGPAQRAPQRPRSPGGGNRWFAVAAGLVFVAIVAAATSGFWWPAKAAARAEAFRVTKRTFSVTLNEKGELEATRSVDVKCEVEGRSTIIWLIPEGTDVKQGDLLVKLASNEIDERVRAEQIKEQNARAAAEAADKELEIALDKNASDIRKAQLALSNAETELRKYMEGDYKQQLLDKQLALETARKTHAQKLSILSDSKELKNKGFLTPREYDDRELQCDQAHVTLQKAELDLQTFNDYTYPKDLRQKQSDVEEARKDLERTQKTTQAEESKLRATTAAKHAEYDLTLERLNKLLEQQKKTQIYAPMPGLVVYETNERRWESTPIAEGSEVYERQTIVKLPDPSQMKVKLRIHEAKTSMIAVGQSATVEVEGVPGARFKGQVTRIAPLADSQNRWLNPDLKEYATEITLDETPQELKPGVTARAEILVRRIENVLAVPIQAVFARSGHHYVFASKDGRNAKLVEIEVGYASAEYVEVSSGLVEGDLVLLAVDDALLAQIPSAEGAEGEGVKGGRAGGTRSGGQPRPRGTGGGGRGSRGS